MLALYMKSLIMSTVSLSPFGDFGVVAGEEDVGDGEVAVDAGAGVLGVLPVFAV